MNKSFSLNVEEQVVSIQLGSIRLQGEITLPENPQGIVVFVDGSGSSRCSARNRYLAHVLHQARGLATILVNLLTSEEEAIDLRSGYCRSNVRFLATRLVGVTDWLSNNSITSYLKIGCLGDRTGGGAALIAASERPALVGAVVARGGEICLTNEVLSYVQAPTLLVVGGNDLPIITMNEDALVQIQTPHKQLEIIPGVNHQFRESGALDEVGRLASCWFKYYLTSPQERELQLHAMSL